jgi:nicotinamide mononucleotide adenylyltransferase
MKKYALYIGRWQTWHAGHEWLINQQLNKGKNVWVAIRDVEVDENNPKTAQQVLISNRLIMVEGLVMRLSTTHHQLILK